MARGSGLGLGMAGWLAATAAVAQTPPDGGQTPWHNQEQEEVYIVLEGSVEICLGAERRVLTQGQAVYIPPTVFHQITNVGQSYARFMYIYGPAGDVAYLCFIYAGLDKALQRLLRDQLFVALPQFLKGHCFRLPV